ncbi:MAG: (2Fe-2S)-binding protein [Firmicutes bacterium]|nr:(2Fe-2S)-binding protein [Bacillota bacterium]
MFKITFQSQTTHSAELEQEGTLLSAASKAESPLNHRCGGHARCGTCKVEVLEGAEHLSEKGTAEARVLEVLKAKPSERLACQAWAKGDVVCRY